MAKINNTATLSEQNNKFINIKVDDRMYGVKTLQEILISNWNESIVCPLKNKPLRRVLVILKFVSGLFLNVYKHLKVNTNFSLFPFNQNFRKSEILPFLINLEQNLHINLVHVTKLSFFSSNIYYM